MTTNALIYLVLGGAGFGLLGAAIAVGGAAAGTALLKRVRTPLIPPSPSESKPNPDRQDFVRSPATVRALAGWITVTLPVVLTVGTLMYGETLPSSFGGYHQGGLQQILIGGFCALGVLLWFYQGSNTAENTRTDLTAVCAFGVGFFPSFESGYGPFHVTFLLLFLGLSAYSSLFSFTTSATLTRRVQIVSGVTMVLSLVLIILVWLLDLGAGELRPLLWLESLAVMATGVSWLANSREVRDERSLSKEVST